MERILIVEDEFIVAQDLKMILQRAGYTVLGIANSVDRAKEFLQGDQVDLVLLDIYLKGKLNGIDLAKELVNRQIAFIYISANSNEKVFELAKSTLPYGFIVKPYRDQDVLLSIDIARYRKENNSNMRLSSELFMQDFIIDISTKSLSWQKKILAMASAFQPYIPFDFIALTGVAGDGTRFSEIGISRTHFDQYSILTVGDFLELVQMSRKDFYAINALLPETTGDAIYIGLDFEKVKETAPMKNLMATTFSLQSNMVKTFCLENGDRITFSFYSKIDNIYAPAHIDLLSFLSPTLEKKLGHIVELEKVGEDGQESHNRTAMKTDAPHNPKFDHIIGCSSQLLGILDKVLLVAPTNTSVLIIGESGTGKEQIARSLHDLSARNTKPMVAVNCAALPADLIESILFGHEKGSFTGALNARVGKFEEANGGTIFLDEIGEMPFNLQSKLLRVLQEKEIERIGSMKPVPVDLRIIAATNLHLEKEISKGKFRLDLFFRLNVFPLHLPPLRQRMEDIPLLTSFFIRKHSKSLGKNITGTSAAFMQKLQRYDWPGNIRELEHIILRSVLLATNESLDEHILELDVPKANEQQNFAIKTITENERDHIKKVLELTKGKIAGVGGAADLLGIPTTTLNSKMKKLGIKP